ncbi:polysaccharide deacetylase family protein [Aneurinibacillus sp. Ricciae_BoGa-3]|uniref:polysaccharide deacetylase family protein n=1 Tax=Aneurinibacillus sp. Ricciae_BoGa-3 TaxID=3022697 RepID=UPI00233FD4D8|nr:polysaccharide deacetylase family protein [Aneurinibacillus sp. Ricciae_BoGa-3]WCK53310.1 polysaccharide deacetylase family protein [Aneurinibacillus sp. Ricciae_BoGa-3]
MPRSIKRIKVTMALIIMWMFTACSATTVHKQDTSIKVEAAPKIESTSLRYPPFPTKPYERTNIDKSLPGVPVLMYHHLLESKENKKFRGNAAVITPEQFGVEMKVLHDNSYRVISLNTLEQYVQGKVKLPSRSVVITFDDGYLSNFKYAAPILRQYHYKATIFLMTGPMQQKTETFNPDKLNHVSWSELANYSDVFDYQAHAHNFHRLIGKTSWFIAKPLPAVENDIHKVKELTHAIYFAYPFGQYNPDTISLLKKEGFRMAFTTRKGRVYPGSPIFELPRNGVFPYTTLNQFKKIIGLNSHKSSVKHGAHSPVL